MPKLKVYRYTAHNPKLSKALGQERHQGQVEAIIATTSQAKAAEAIGVTIGAFRNYGGETHNDESRAAALQHPGEVLYSRLSQRGGPWVFVDGSAVETEDPTRS